MPENNKSRYPGYTEARKKANKKYMENFVEVKVRMTPEKRETIKAHAKKQEESATSFINRAIDETMERDNTVLPDNTNSPDSES